MVLRPSRNIFLYLIFYFLHVQSGIVNGQNGAVSAEVLTIQNTWLTAKFSKLGAELISLKDQAGLEYIWQADIAFWSQHAPILFPIVGNLKDGYYYYKDEKFRLPQHGFARNMQFSVIELKPDCITLQLQSDDSSRQCYPFDFTLTVRYNLEGKRLKSEISVVNVGMNDMYFSLGLHPGFNCPLFPGEKKSDYTLVFNKREKAKIHLRKGGFRTGKTEDFAISDKAIPIRDELFDNGALILSGLRSNTITLRNTHKAIMQLSYKGFDYLGLWSRSAVAPFICIEPWSGVTDVEWSTHFLEDTDGINLLGKGEQKVFSYAIKL